MCDPKNELHKSEYDKSKDYTSTRLNLDITETTDSYPEFDFLDLLRKSQASAKQLTERNTSRKKKMKGVGVFTKGEGSRWKYGLGGFDERDAKYEQKVKEKKPKRNSVSENSTNKSNLFSDEDSDVEALAKLYEEKYGTCNDYAKLGEGYDEEDSFIDNSDAVNDLVPSGLRTELGGFYINRGKLNFVKEDHSSSSNSEDVDKFLAHNRLKSRRIISDDEAEEKESCKVQSNNQSSSYAAVNNSSNILSSSNNNNNNNSINSSNNNNHCGNNNNSSLHNNIIKSRKRSGEFQHKSKKIRKTATPKIPDHLLYKKPFPGSLEYRKNISEFKKNKLKTAETDKKSTVTNSLVNSSNKDSDNNINNSHSNNTYTVNSSNNNNSEDDNDNDNDKKECSAAKKKPLTVKELLKERDGSSVVSESVVTGQQDGGDKRTSSSSDSFESSSSDSDSDSSEDTSVEKEKVPAKSVEESPPKNATINGSISKDITAKSFAHLSDSLKELIAKVVEISKEEKNKCFNSKLNSLLLSLDDKLRELPMAERNAVLDHVAVTLQMKKDNITKRTKKLLVLQEEAKMSTPLRKLKEDVNALMPLLESNYFNEYTRAAGTSPQIYAELSRYYWSIDPGSLPQRKFPWNDQLRQYLREIVQYRKNCYYIIRPRKESLMDYIKSFMETKVKTFWPKEWMTVEVLLEEAQLTPRQTDDKQKTITKILGTQNSPNAAPKKTSPNVPAPNVSNRKQSGSGSTPSSVTSSTGSRKPSQGPVKNPEVKSILIPRKTPQQGSSSGNALPKPNFSASALTSLQNSQQGSRPQVTLNRLNFQEYYDRVSGPQASVSRNSSQQISPNRSQQSVSPNRLVKTSSPNSVLNPSVIRPSVSKNTSPTSATKSISSVRNSVNSQSVLKTIGIHSNPSAPGMKTSPNSVTISPVNESIFKDITPSPEVLNLTKNSSVYISRVKDCGEAKSGRSNSPSIGIPLPSGITISPTNASPSTFLAKPQKQGDRNSDLKINVSITKQESGINQNTNVKREGPLQNIPDCISVTSKVVSNDRQKFEHVRKRALQEYHQQQQSPERLKSEEKKAKAEENLLTGIEMKEEKLDDKNFSKIFDSVIAKTSETVRQSESASSERFGMESPVKNSSAGVSQLKNLPTKLRDVRGTKDKPFYGGPEEKGYDDMDERNETTREQRVQMEMDRVMQNLVELSREKNSEYEFESQHVGYPTSPPAPSGLKSSSFQEAFQKMLFK